MLCTAQQYTPITDQPLDGEWNCANPYAISKLKQKKNISYPTPPTITH